jgi:GntR family histidine utilization transcriptional repressor
MTTGQEATLHHRILGDIERRIVSGEWPPGHRLPFEVDLAAQYGCSRMTANKVLTQLARAGLIERRRKSGSFVAQPVGQAAVLEIHDIETEVRSLKLPYSFRLVKRGERKAKTADRQHMELAPSASVLDLVCIHHAGERPFCLEERLINLTTVPEAAGEDFTKTAPGAWLISRVPWSAAEHRIYALAAGTEAAAALDIGRTAACLAIERRTWGSTGPVTFVRYTYPGDRHALVARFTPGGQIPGSAEAPGVGRRGSAGTT